MTPITLVRFTHANNNEQIYITKQLIAGFYHSTAQKCTFIAMTGGAVFPAKETVEEVRQRLGYQIEGETNG